MSDTNITEMDTKNSGEGLQNDENSLLSQAEHEQNSKKRTISEISSPGRRLVLNWRAPVSRLGCFH